MGLEVFAVGAHLGDEGLGGFFAEEVFVDGELRALEAGKGCGEDVFDIAGGDDGGGGGEAELGGICEEGFGGAVDGELLLKVAVGGLDIGDGAVDDLVAEGAGFEIVRFAILLSFSADGVAVLRDVVVVVRRGIGGNCGREGAGARWGHGVEAAGESGEECREGEAADGAQGEGHGRGTSVAGRVGKPWVPWWH